MPATLLMHEFGNHLWETFGTPAYHVGSSLRSKKFRDVDVRIILSDEEWLKWGFGEDPNRCHENAKWVALVLAFSELGKKITGLPIDFQIQQQSDANKRWPRNRSALVLNPWRFKK